MPIFGDCMGSQIRVLHVDDDPQSTDLVRGLSRHSDRLDVDAVSTAAAARQELQRGGIDCVVSEYDLREETGIDFLRAVRPEYPDLPFLLFTSTGSEEIASRAISAGVTDYLRKRPETGQLALLANRIENAVDRVRSDHVAERRTRRLETLVSNLPGMVYRCRNEGGWPMEYVVGEVERLVGYEPEALESGAVNWGEEVLHPDDRDRAWEAVQSSIDGDEPFEVTYRVRTADGDVKWLWERGRVVEAPFGDDDSAILWGDGSAIPRDGDGADTEMIEGFITDITERKKRESELRRSERRFQAIFDDPNLLVGLTAPDGTVEEVNTTALRYVDADRADIVGMPLPETPWWDGESNVDAWEAIEQAANGEYVEFEAEYAAEGERPLFVEGSFRPVTDENDEVTALVVSARDVSTRRRREAALQRQHDRLNEYASFVSHDFQSPISTIRGRLELALETDDLTHVERAIDAVERVDELRTGLVETLRSGDIVRETELVRLTDVFEDVWATTDPGGHASYEVVDERRIEADPEAIRRVFENLVSNSIEHGDGDVTVRVGATAEGLFYEDDGPGIAPGIRDEVFSPGFSTKAGSEGIGMGMASVRQIVAAHGWTIGVGAAETLGGARFEIVTE
ncbi:PAS domain S-box-containing protein [Halobellus clavatus]|uniref:histidine kinase n=2 Tax=Halobellus clavatus TaxID=660517 RepID=A0A1H3KQU8_9EURY|nr:PAS domain S-box-containing protein [Halobellus clavatus]